MRDLILKINELNKAFETLQQRGNDLNHKIFKVMDEKIRAFLKKKGLGRPAVFAEYCERSDGLWTIVSWQVHHPRLLNFNLLGDRNIHVAKCLELGGISEGFRDSVNISSNPEIELDSELDYLFQKYSAYLLKKKKN